jgi:rubrerythrin
MKPILQNRMNRTGMAMAKDLARPMLQNSRVTPSSEGDAQDAALVRIRYAKQKEPVGSMPPPATNGSVKSARTPPPPIFLDKLGERLAFERSGVRLYDALLSKFDAFGSWKGGPTRADLEHIRSEEYQHFRLLQDALTRLGADPTAVTPSANIHAVASKGLPAVLTDPRTSLQECLEAILIAELVDNDCWENLSDLAAGLGEDELSSMFRGALEQEREHLTRVRLWTGAALTQLAGGRTQAKMTERALEREARNGGEPATVPTRVRAAAGKVAAKRSSKRASRASSAKRSTSSRGRRTSGKRAASSR